MKKVLIIISSLLILIGIGIFILMYDFNLKIKSIKLISYNSSDKEITIEITKEKGIINNKFVCYDNVNHKVSNQKNTCTLTIPIGYDYEIYLSNTFHQSNKYKLTDYIDDELEFKFQKQKIYLAINGEEEIKYTPTSITSNSKDYNIYSENEKVAKIENSKVIGVSNGTTKIYEEKSKEFIEVIVTDLITIPTVNQNKERIPCNRYTEEENKLLDEILEDRVNEAGYGTRAGAVAAARFLTLEFPYKIPYFYENGRIDDTGINFADGEGRFYHKGLYLSESKFNELLATFSGPAIWGCPLCNWEDDKYFGYYEGRKIPNGLDCSGFVSWAVHNGGFDPGDIGAGETPDAYQMTDLGEFVFLTKEVLESGKIRVGDFFNYWGHISIIIGMDENHYYVAESLPNFGGVDVRIYTPEEALDEFRYIVFMDDYYKKDGNYTEMWH